MAMPRLPCWVESLIKPLRQADEQTRNLLNAIVEDNRVAKDGEKKKIPPLGLRGLEPDCTRKAHVMHMYNLKGRQAYTLAEELSSLNLNRQGYYFRGDFARLLFDNGMVGNNNAMLDQPCLSTPCN